MLLTHLKLKGIFLFSSLFISAALLPAFINGVVNGDSWSILVPSAVVAGFIIIGLSTLLVHKNTVRSISFTGDNCVIRTGERAYSLPDVNFVKIRKVMGSVSMIYKDISGTKKFVLRRFSSGGSHIDLSEMRRRFPNAVFSV